MRVLLVVLALFVTACAGARPGGSPGAGPHIGAASMEDRTCSRDSECVLVEDCCGCSSGGQRLAVRADRREALEASAGATCGERVCATVVSDHPSCGAAAARCSGGLCVPQI
jgi:hypothetical protein